jgi:hypothetical protein
MSLFSVEVNQYIIIFVIPPRCLAVYELCGLYFIDLPNFPTVLPKMSFDMPSTGPWYMDWGQRYTTLPPLD